MRREESNGDTPLTPVKRAEDAGTTFAAIAAVLSGLWILGSLMIVAALAPGGLRGLTAFQGVALLFMSVLPAGLLLFGGFVAREGVRARVQARRLADAADRMMNPSPVAEASARRLGISIRSEIVALDRAMEEALAKLTAVEDVIRRQSAAVDKATAVAQAGAGHMVSGLEREREALLKISEDLERRTREIIEAISRQSKGIADAANNAEQRLRAADESVTQRISSFGAAASLIAERTGQMDRAAASAGAGAEKLEASLVEALEALAQATRLTDAAKHSVETATQAANATAGALRDTTAQAVEEAKRAAEIVRSQAQAVEKEAAAALGVLRETAEGARTAAVEMRQAVGAPPPRHDRPAPVSSARPFSFGPTIEPSHDEPLPPPAERFSAFETEPEAPKRRGFSFGIRRADRSESRRSADRWTWRDLFGGGDARHDSEDADSRFVVAAPNDFDPFNDRNVIEGETVTRTRVRAVDLISKAGLHLDEIFGIAALDRIAARARNGTQARRRAVRDAAPEAVHQLTAALDGNDRMRAEAAALLQEDGPRIAELLGRGRASMSADATRAFLLLDAAFG